MWPKISTRIPIAICWLLLLRVIETCEYNACYGSYYYDYYYDLHVVSFNTFAVTIRRLFIIFSDECSVHNNNNNNT